MPDFYLIGDESIVLTTHNVILEKERYEAILTNRRLILIRTAGGKASSREIALREIGSAIAGESGLGEPTITLTFTTSDGVLQAKELVFLKDAAGQDSLHYSEWVKKLKELVKIAAQEPAPAPVILQEQEEVGSGKAEKTDAENGTVKEATISACEPGATAGSPEPLTEGGAPPIVPASLPPSRSKKTEIQGPAAGKIGRGAIIIIVFIIAGFIIGGVYYSTHHRGQLSQEPQPIVTEITQATTPPTVSPVPVTTLPTISEGGVITSAPVTPTPEPGGGEVIVPPTGIWLRVQYAGNFTGTIGIQGGMRDIAGRGDRLFQIPATGGIIDASVQKQDDSGNVLTVTFYNNGTAVKQGNMTAPHGTLSLNAWI